ncbi:MFS transporter [Kribbella sp. CA-293567]|uniref:MFS transporter n=1 Tax=Kribbella sp. CA-293567 TaxID=3002436 RepID=UPI0022DDE766|nr:MFS transporter [Kribbella sp. CA-293567]WBQ06814.1 MFS transporter [Kribbella sp. CA-293567]
MRTSTSSARITLLVLATAAASFSMLQSLVSPALPVIQRDLHTSQGTVTWTLTAWLLSASVATPLLGRIGDLAGKKRTLLIALAAVAAGSLIAALAPTIGVLIAGRVVQGLGGAIFPLAFGIVHDEFPAERVPSLVGILSAVIAGGGGLGIVLAGPVVQNLDWRWLFWIPLVVIGLAMLAAYRFVPESPSRHPGRVDWFAAAALSSWLVALLLPLSKATVWGWGSGRTTGLLVLAVVLFAGWVAIELRSRNPLIDMRMMRLPAVWTTNLVALLFGAAMFAVYAFVPQFMQVPASTGYGFGATVTRAGLLMLPMLVGMALAGSLSGPVAPRFDVKAQLILGSAFGFVSCTAFALFHDRPWQVAAAGGVFGLGIGLAYASMTSLIVQNVPQHQTGAASGMNANIRTIGGSIGTAVVSSIITAHTATNGLPREAGFTDAFIVLAALSAAAVLLALLVPAARRRGSSAPAPVAPVAPALQSVETH